MAIRVVAAAAYLAGSLFWALLMFAFAKFRCDDACYGGIGVDWSHNPDAWQYDTLICFGFSGLGFAIVAVTSAWRHHDTARAAVVVHSILYVANCVVLFGGRDPRFDGSPYIFGALLVVTAAVALVTLGRRSTVDAPREIGTSR